LAAKLCLSKFASNSLALSGRIARWNSNKCAALATAA
jgi:hypothetical protein